MADDILAPPPSVPLSSTAPSLPDFNVNHTAAFVNEIDNRLHAFASVLAALRQAKEGAESEYNDKIAKMNSEHIEAMDKIDRKITDIEGAQRMAQAAKDASPALAAPHQEQDDEEQS